MKQPKKLTRDLKEAVSAYNLNADDWMLAQDGEIYVKIIHKETGITKMIDKLARQEKGVGIW